MSDVPHLRFPEFSGEWEETELQDIVPNICSGKDRISNNGEVTLYGSTGVIGRTNSVSYKENIVLVARVGANAGQMQIGNAPCGVTDNTLVIDAKEWNFYIYYFLQHYNLNRLVFGSGQPLITGGMLKKIKVRYGCYAERNKITRLLCLIDERIATQNKIIEDLKLLKDAITERLYSEVNGTVYTYHQLFDVINERNKDNVYNNVLSASQELGMIDRSDINIDIKFEQASIVSYKIVRKGDYVVHLRSFQGGFAFSEKTGICSPAYTILRPNDNLIYGYLSHYFTSKQFVKSLKLVTYGIRDGRSINVDEWLDMKVAIPEKQVQSHILTTINSIGCRLRNEDKIYSRLIKQKSYLLRQMFI